MCCQHLGCIVHFITAGDIENGGRGSGSISSIVLSITTLGVAIAFLLYTTDAQIHFKTDLLRGTLIVITCIAI